jgi:hypothetical protein
MEKNGAIFISYTTTQWVESTCESSGSMVMGYTFSNARLKTKESYGVDGIRFSEYQRGLYHLRRPPATVNEQKSWKSDFIIRVAEV